MLDQLSAGIFVGNTNVTYPMKTLMLLTGFMPAFDSQVRSGLDNAGFMGMNATQFLLPEDSAGANARKISRLPFYLGNCYTQYRELLKGAVARSPQPRLTRDPGRLFDVLFFMQGRKDSARLLSFEPESRWYALP
ncbi:hypothetical protein BGI27_05180 [Candidatus Dactylopiibacterium carminicum]|uniref:Uncharacterized protein n=1 Tax=Candidatus Dactylopiibacterium carminicum TaxID=857335 RepID=A0ABQ7HS28_9RHOO|nr:hypothetical protein [Candidatus Dactylopiibacterium carminicum]KAF7599982.1 hypothetical protein BGI27_05180 [Candidatus Dactylopiibacterium carminicum]PAS99984.1 MAG: hypothetical protein BSR46_05215 [Candidatus Dactylopiibacterium carminicum]